MDIKARVFDGDLAEEIRKLKSEPGKPILAIGGAGFMRSLIATGLIDEYHLATHPVVLGEGLTIFNGVPRMDLKLVDVKAFPGGRPSCCPGARPSHHGICFFEKKIYLLVGKIGGREGAPDWQAIKAGATRIAIPAADIGSGLIANFNWISVLNYRYGNRSRQFCIGHVWRQGEECGESGRCHGTVD